MADLSPNSEQEPSDQGQPPRSPRLGDFMWIGTACAVSILAAGGIGYWIDNWAHSTPLWTFVGLAFGIACAVLLTINQVKKYT